MAVTNEAIGADQVRAGRSAGCRASPATASAWRSSTPASPTCRRCAAASWRAWTSRTTRHGRGIDATATARTWRASSRRRAERDGRHARRGAGRAHRQPEGARRATARARRATSSRRSTGRSSIARRYGIRVINLSLGGAVLQSWRDDPMCQAVERAYRAGIVVVASAGNYGKTADGTPVLGGITVPGNSPFAITVGALNTKGTACAVRRRGGELQLEGADAVRPADQAGPGRRRATGFAACWRPGRRWRRRIPELVIGSGRGRAAGAVGDEHGGGGGVRGGGAVGRGKAAPDAPRRSGDVAVLGGTLGWRRVAPRWGGEIARSGRTRHTAAGTSSSHRRRGSGPGEDGVRRSICRGIISGNAGPSSGVTPRPSSGVTPRPSSGDARRSSGARQADHLGRASIIWGNAEAIIWGNAEAIIWSRRGHHLG